MSEWPLNEWPSHEWCPVCGHYYAVLASDHCTNCEEDEGSEV